MKMNRNTRCSGSLWSRLPFDADSQKISKEIPGAIDGPDEHNEQVSKTAFALDRFYVQLRR